MKIKSYHEPVNTNQEIWKILWEYLNTLLDGVKDPDPSTGEYTFYEYSIPYVNDFLAENLPLGFHNMVWIILYLPISRIF